MEAFSVEDDSEGVSFNVFVNNIQPGVEINYLDGTSKLESENVSNKAQGQEKQNTQNKNTIYVLNTNTRQYILNFHVNNLCSTLGAASECAIFLFLCRLMLSSVLCFCCRKVNTNLEDERL